MKTRALDPFHVLLKDHRDPGKCLVQRGSSECEAADWNPLSGFRSRFSAQLFGSEKRVRRHAERPVRGFFYHAVLLPQPFGEAVDGDGKRWRVMSLTDVQSCNLICSSLAQCARDELPATAVETFQTVISTDEKDAHENTQKGQHTRARQQD